MEKYRVHFSIVTPSFFMKYTNAANADTKMRTTVAVVVINETSERNKYIRIN